MNRSYISEISKKSADKTVLIKGWVAEIRDLNKIKFLILRDKTGVIQTIANKETPKEPHNIISELTVESVIEIEGKVKLNKEAKQGYEIQITNLKLLSLSEAPLPIDTSSKSNTKIDKRLDHRFLDMRRPEIRAIFSIRSKIVKNIVNFFDENGFTNINSPKLTIAGLESGAELFSVDYFGRPAYLSQSPQLYKQMFVASGLEKVYEIGPVFRAEKSHTTRHLTEFTGVDLEMAFIKDENDVMDILEEMFKNLITNINKECSSELNLLEIETIHLPKKIPRITMTEAKKLLAEKGKKLKDDDDLDSEAEELLGHIIKNKYDSELVFITKYPFVVRPFYHMLDEQGLTNSFDLLYNGVEISSGAQREHRLEILKKQAKQKGIKLESIYSDIMRFGIPPHGGCGLGLDRITQRMLKLPNVREAILLPRDPERLTP